MLKSLMIVDYVGGYVSTDRELREKLLWENAKEKGLILSKAEVPKWRIAIGLKGNVSLDHGLRVKCFGSRKSLRIESPEGPTCEGDPDHRIRETGFCRSSTLGYCHTKEMRVLELKGPKARLMKEIWIVDSGGQMSADLPFRKISSQQQQGLRFETPGS
jgi:hypothetical protein